MEDPPDGSEGSTWLLRRVDWRQVYGRLLARSCSGTRKVLDGDDWTGRDGVEQLALLVL